MPPILTEKEPPAFGERNQTGLSPILFISDHHRNRVPASLNNLGLPDEERARHIGYDIGIAWIADYLSDRFDAPLVHTNYSRLVIDCNRQPGTPDASPVVADGTRIPGNIDLSNAALDARRTELFEPYHAAIRARLDAMEADGRTPLCVALHSFTPMMKDSGTPRPWDIGIIWNKDDRLVVPIIEALRRNRDLTIGDNEPYSGRDSGFSLQAHPEPRGHPHFGVEFRQDLVASEKDAREQARIFGNALEIAVSSLTL